MTVVRASRQSQMFLPLKVLGVSAAFGFCTPCQAQQVKEVIVWCHWTVLPSPSQSQRREREGGTVQCLPRRCHMCICWDGSKKRKPMLEHLQQRTLKNNAQRVQSQKKTLLERKVGLSEDRAQFFHAAHTSARVLLFQTLPSHLGQGPPILDGSEVPHLSPVASCRHNKRPKLRSNLSRGHWGVEKLKAGHVSFAMLV